MGEDNLNPNHKEKHVKKQYTSTASFERQQFILKQFPEAFQVDRLLDIGGGQNVLEQELNEHEFSPAIHSLDNYGQPDIKVDLEKRLLPFNKNSFETVVCVEVLEHLDSIHRVFDLILDTASSYVVLSLPNLSHWFFRYKFLLGRRLSDKYQLKPTRQPDRHKWLTSYNDARNFIQTQIRD